MRAIFPDSPQDWTKAKPGKIYYNSKTRQYTSTIVTDKQTILSANLVEESRKYYEDFVLNVCKNLNKEENITDIVGEVELLGNYIDPSPLIKEKILLGISEDEFANLEEKQDVDISGLITNIYNLNNFFERIEKIAKKFEQYQVQYVQNIFQNSSNSFSNVDFLMESENLYKFGENVKSLIESNNLDSSSYSKMEISYGDSQEIKKITLSEDIDMVNLRYLFEDFINTYPQNNKQTVEFIFNLSELEKDTTSNNQNYETIVEKYFLNSEKKPARSTNIIARSSNFGKATAVKNSDTEDNFASLKEVSNRSARLLQQEILNSVYRTPCMTPEERERINRKLERETGKRASFARELSLSVSDAFFQNLPDVLNKVANKQGDEALKYLGRNFLNRMGVCGIGDLTSLVMNTVFAYINEQEYADELSKCAVQNLNNQNVSKLWEELERLNKNAEILERYRKFVGDTIPPWTTGGYLPPDYRKDLDTDDPISAKYTLTIETPIEDTDIDARFTAFKNSIAASIRGEELLDILVNTFPDEMGWLNFFTDMTKGILNKCRVPMPNIGVSFEANWCQKRVNYPEFEDIPKSNASFAFRPSTIGTILVEELKNIIINLTVRAVIASMRQIFQIIAAGTSFDSDYFKQKQYIPDLFQNENDIQSQIADFCNETTSSFRVVNSTVRGIFQETYPSTYQVYPLSLEDVDKFLKSCSVALGRYDKIRLYKGEAEETTYQKVLELVDGTNISQFLIDYSDIEQVFMSIGQVLDTNAIEEGFYSEVRTETPVTVEYCGINDDSLGMAYGRNKPDISAEQIEQMKQVLKDIQKDKICFAAETVGNPKGVIVGQIGEMLVSKTGPIFGRISEEMGKLFEPVIENQIETVAKNYRNDLYNSRGLFDLIRVNDGGVGENRRQLASFFGTPPIDENIRSLANSKISNYSYSPTKSSTNITLGFDQATSVRYRESNDNIKVADMSVENISTSKYEGEFESGANRIQALLVKNQDILRDSLNKKVSRSFISSGVLTNIIDDYYEDMKNKLLAPRRTYINNWGNIYKDVQENEDYIPLLLGEKKIIEDTKRLYGLIDPFDEKYRYVPFNVYKSKEEAAISYATFLMLVNTVTSEILLKSLPVYEAFGSDLLENYEMLGEYIYQKFENTIDDFSNDRRRIKVLEKLVQTTIIATNEGLLPPISSDIQKNVDRINLNIKSWINGNRGDRVKNLEKNEKDIEDIARFFVYNASKAYIKEFQKSMSEIEDNSSLPSIASTSSISRYILDNSIISGLQDVISDVNKSGILEKRLVLEKYIRLRNPKSGYPGGVQNLSDFRDYLLENPIEGKISDYWDSWHFGIRISSIFDFDSAGISESEINLSTRNEIKGFTILSDSDSTETERYFLSPLVVYEKEIADTKISSSIVNQYDPQSMKKGLSEINDFSNFYYRGMNIENLISLTTIYINEEFGNFLSNNEPVPVILPSTVTNWKLAGEKILNDTKKYIVNTLERI